MVHYIIFKKHILLRNIIVLLITISALLYHLIPILINFKTFQTSVYYLSEIIFVLFMIYNLLTCLILFRRIQDKEIWIGMTRQMALESWGKPTRINRYGHGLPLSSSEHWIYGSGNNKMYAAFNNDVLVSWYD